LWHVSNPNSQWTTRNPPITTFVVTTNINITVAATTTTITTTTTTEV
jgi:uncharacterized protein YjdB